MATGGPPLRVLHLAHRAATGGGIQTYVANAIASLEGRGVVARVASVLPGELPPRLAHLDHHVDARPASPARRAWRFRRWLQHHVRDADVVHVHGLFTWQFLLGVAAARSAGVPFIASPHGCLEPWFLEWRGVVRTAYARSAARRLLPHAYTTLVTAAAEAETVRRIDARIRVDVVCPGIAVPERMPERVAAADGPLRVLFLSQLEPKKGLPVLLRAISQLRRAGPVTLDVAGSGVPDYERQIRDEVRELGLDAVVTLHGFLSGERKAEVLRRAQVMALPSYSENFGFVIAEAMAEGLPVVTTPAVAAHEFIQRCGGGRVVPAGDPEALAAALAVYRDAKARGEAGTRAHACARREFSLQVMGERLEALYRAATRPR